MAEPEVGSAHGREWLGAEALSTLAPTSVNNRSTTWGAHAFPEAVLVFTLTI